MQTLKIAVIPGDGIGKEVIPESIRSLEAAGRLFSVQFEWTEFDWTCETYHRTGRMMPDDGIETLKEFDAIYLGAVGFPGVPDHVSLWGLLLPIRRKFDQYVNLRPVRLFEGVPVRWSEKTPETSTSTSSAKMSRASIHRLVESRTKAQSRKPSHNSATSHDTAPTESFGTPSSCPNLAQERS